MKAYAIKILMVEDNPVDAIRLKNDLKEINRKKCEFAQAESLREAQDLLCTEVFHLILLDLGLPDAQGIDTLMGIQNFAPDTPVVVMSGLDDESVAVEAVARGAQDYLLKDKWDPQLIGRSLHYAVQRHQLLAAYKGANESSQRANRALRVLSECNHFLVRATEEQQFLDDICRILVDHGGYRMAWIGFKLQDEARSVKPVAVTGFEEGYLEAAKITWSDDATGRGPTGTAIRTGIITTNRNSWTDRDYTPWRSEALKRDYVSSIALPLTGHNGIFGALSIYSGEPDAFDDEEVKLLGQLADDVSYGIKTLRMRDEKEKADLALQESEQRFRAIFDGAKDYIVLKDRSSRYTLVNPAVERLLGLPASKIVGSRDEDFFGEEGAAQVRDVEMRVLRGKSIEEEHTRQINGIPRTFLDSRIPWRDGQGNVTGILTISREITERKGMESPPAECEVVYSSKAMKFTLSLANVAAQNDSTVLLLGESGSGKDYMAKHIHNCSARASGPYFSVNCASIAASLAESELFGHEKGAFTGAHGRKRGLLELAEGGTLLMNEIGELSLPLQAKLLTFLDTRKFTRVGGEKEITVNVRLIAATNRDLEKEVETGGFRKDLFYRINVMSIRVPPLRERRQDIPILVQEILSQLCQELHISSPPIIGSVAMEGLKKYDWPGNVRELRNVLERSLILSEGREVSLGNLELRRDAEDTGKTDGDWSFATSFPDNRSLNEITQDLKRSLVNEALRRSKGSRQGAARLLGISRYSLKHYMKALGMMESDSEAE